MVPPPVSKKPVLSGDPETDKQIRRATKRAHLSVAERLLKGSCSSVWFIIYFLGSFYDVTVKAWSQDLFVYPDPAEFGCSICRAVIKEPLTTPCAHNFCKTCLLGKYDSQSSVRERSRGGRTLRAQKIVKTCPSCPTDICDFLENPQVCWSTEFVEAYIL